MLDDRLQTVASLVRKNVKVADIGTDHGYLIAYLVQSGHTPCAIATDVNKKPLASARKYIQSKGLDSTIETRLCNGVLPLEGLGVQDVVIAGMGGELILWMIEEALWLQNTEINLVLQPMTRPEILRLGLARLGFAITKEVAVISGKHVYTAMQVQYIGEEQILSFTEQWLGGLAKQIDSNPTSATLCYFRRIAQRLEQMIRSETDDALREKMNTLRITLERML